MFGGWVVGDSRLSNFPATITPITPALPANPNFKNFDLDIVRGGGFFDGDSSDIMPLTIPDRLNYWYNLILT